MAHILHIFDRRLLACPLKLPDFFVLPMLEDFDLTAIHDLEGARQAIARLLNLVEDLSSDLREAQAENQRLRDENNRLKGEQGQPQIKANKKPEAGAGPRDYSSESERKKPRARRKKGSKVAQLHIDREVTLTVDPATLPADAEFKGHVPVVIQDLQIKTDNILFHKEKFYSATTRQVYLASLPKGYVGAFGPNVKAWTIVLYFGLQTSEPKLVEFFHTVGLQISPAQVSNLLIHKQDGFHAEKAAVYEAGVRSSPYQQIDDTGVPVNGQNQHCHIVCNLLYTAFLTTEKKDRLSVIDVLRNLAPRAYVLNAETTRFLERLHLPQPLVVRLTQLPQEQVWDETSFLALLQTHLPELGPQQRTHILDAAAVAAYHQQLDFPVIDVLLCDDAPQFKFITAYLGLCWVHDGRHYKKLTPVVALHQQLLTAFLARYWAYYRKLRDYQAQPTPALATQLRQEFDEVFSTQTGYTALDERIAKTLAKKESLLLVLHHPELPLHNNEAELGARAVVRKRDVSLGPRTAAGRKAWDTFLTLRETARKLEVNFYAYIRDRVTGENLLPSLAELIQAQAERLRLNASWPALQASP